MNTLIFRKMLREMPQRPLGTRGHRAADLCSILWHKNHNKMIKLIYCAALLWPKPLPESWPLTHAPLKSHIVLWMNTQSFSLPQWNREDPQKRNCVNFVTRDRAAPETSALFSLSSWTSVCHQHAVTLLKKHFCSRSNSVNLIVLFYEWKETNVCVKITPCFEKSLWSAVMCMYSLCYFHSVFTPCLISGQERTEMGSFYIYTKPVNTLDRVHSQQFLKMTHQLKNS